MWKYAISTAGSGILKVAVLQGTYLPRRVTFSIGSVDLQCPTRELGQFCPFFTHPREKTYIKLEMAFESAYSLSMTDEAPKMNNIALQMDMKDMGGVWANFASVKHSQYEFTIDFARLDFDPEGSATGVVVSRVNLSPLFVSQLIDALQVNWQIYSDKAMPPEVRDHG